MSVLKSSERRLLSDARRQKHTGSTFRYDGLRLRKVCLIIQSYLEYPGEMFPLQTPDQLNRRSLISSTIYAAMLPTTAEDGSE
ncbi:hypothetical protein [aff. Roholtiella sp. LEGE 12411]|uniref:hypothetical protein n=1 Tax=aff. Roholtiella sp. LEGE 12411 TaxID=1828822 RepID=UPI00187F0749|nr:hypothetical protein [aff. Roholtiella sp. LEGE 12411]MBE9034822.1 hypothetical protein [aff. Roholtiella sp. LEGE 12411]